MKRITWMICAVTTAFFMSLGGPAEAQVVEERDGARSNPAVSIFKATLYGAATGLVLGGAFALVEDDESISTGDALTWGFAGGAAGGAIIGLVYVITREDPEGSVEDISLLGSPDDEQYVALPSISTETHHGLVGTTARTTRVRVLNVRL